MPTVYSTRFKASARPIVVHGVSAANFIPRPPTEAIAPMTGEAESRINSMRYMRRWAIAALLVATGLSCRSSSGPVPTVWAAIVYGVVTDATGAPAAGVFIESEVYRPTCVGGEQTGKQQPDSRSNGRSWTLSAEDSERRQQLRAVRARQVARWSRYSPHCGRGERLTPEACRRGQSSLR